MKQSFKTTAYKKGFIHICYSPETRKEEIQSQVGQVTRDCKTFTGAKRIITKMLKEQGNKIGDFIGS